MAVSAWSSSSLSQSSVRQNSFSSTRTTTVLSSKSSSTNADEQTPSEMGRRGFMAWGAAASLALSTQLLTSQAAHASLLDEFGSDPSKIENKVTTSTTVASSPVGKQSVEIDPSLRASYYYPTAKKRYLPRIQKVSTEIVACTDALLTEDWETVTGFGKTAENAILPLQLYVSSLDGQGLSMSTGFAKQMRQDAADYEKAYKAFEQALKKKDSPQALQAVSAMGVAVADYRQAGRLKDDDGNIPSIDEMKRMAMRRPTVRVMASN
eukprot:CAMPEP_0172447168 /NCGR_PEP_ID=MMETSP1065-20121228/6536_1 /TAXON_ID=265537 /ORGANISM="Amphiprora paludosa, Strain CCMP125" /LENGTH=264 /DNA_ID=CAMNT_0013198403 /DNA_START=145 /DNA_END=939 /DNA_ORIENTATION=-